MIKLMEIDLFFNLEHHSVDSEHNFEKFSNDMLQIYEEERLSAIEPKIPKIPESYGEKQQAPKDKLKTIINMIRKLYWRSKIDPKIVL